MYKLTVFAILRRALGTLTTSLTANLIPVWVPATIAHYHFAEVAALTGFAEIFVKLLVMYGFCLACY